VVSDHVAGDLSLSIFKSLVGKVFKAKSGGVVSGSLFRVPNPKGEMS